MAISKKSRKAMSLPLLRTCEDLSAASVRATVLSDQDMAALKEGFPFLVDFLYDFIRRTPLGGI